MTDLDVRIVRLEPMRVASALGFGESPEGLAWDKLLAWYKASGLAQDGKLHRFFGFNNPNPSAGSPSYGYEVWVTVDEGVQPEGEIKLKSFAGGLYAVTRCEVKGDPGELIPAAWQRLVRWHESSRYGMGRHQWLEEHIGLVDTPSAEFVLDLYLPVKE